jgi:hypothetical protein
MGLNSKTYWMALAGNEDGILLGLSWEGLEHFSQTFVEDFSPFCTSGPHESLDSARVAMRLMVVDHKMGRDGHDTDRSPQYVGKYTSTKQH